MEPALGRERGSLPHRLRRPKGPGLLLRGGLKDTARPGQVGTQPTRGQARSPAGHTGAFPALSPAGAGELPQRPPPHAKVCCGPNASPSARSYLPRQSLVEKPQRFSEARFLALLAQGGMPGGPRAPLRRLQPRVLHCFHSAASARRTPPGRAPRSPPRLRAPAQRGDRKPVSGEPCPETPKSQVPRADKDPTRQGNTNLSPAGRPRSAPLPACRSSRRSPCPRATSGGSTKAA